MTLEEIEWLINQPDMKEAVTVTLKKDQMIDLLNMARESLILERSASMNEASLWDNAEYEDGEGIKKL